MNQAMPPATLVSLAGVGHRHHGELLHEAQEVDHARQLLVGLCVLLHHALQHRPLHGRDEGRTLRDRAGDGLHVGLRLDHLGGLLQLSIEGVDLLLRGLQHRLHGHWRLGLAALEKQLVDELKTSDEYLAERAKSAELFHLHYAEKKTLQERVGLAGSVALDRFVLNWLSRLNQQRFW